jgi:hypothetical protein
MTRSLNHLLKHLLLCTSIALLAACGAQEGASTDKSTDLAGTNTALTAPDNVANSATTAAPASSSSPLLASLATTYPGGKLPESRAAQAAADLVQNPAALQLTAETAPLADAGLSGLTAQSTFQTQTIQPQAIAADYLPVQRIQNTTLYGAYFFSIYPGEVTSALAGNPNWRLEGPAFWASLATGPDLYPVHRFQNKINGSYLYTIYDSERADIVANYSATFTYEGIAWYARQTASGGWSALYRFRNKTNGTYLFSAYEAEKDAIVANYSAVFALEGVAYYVRQDAPIDLPAACAAAPIAATGYSLVFKGCDAANVVTYYTKDECVRDNVTGLIWQGQTTSGLRARNNYYSNYDNTATLQTSDAAFNPIAVTQAQIDASTNSVGFKNAVNASNLCGFNNWRLPNKDELLALVKPSNTPQIDTTWFVNMGANPSNSFWSSSTTGTPDIWAWAVYFDTGFLSGGNTRRATLQVRLVR